MKYDTMDVFSCSCRKTDKFIVDSTQNYYKSCENINFIIDFNNKWFRIDTVDRKNNLITSSKMAMPLSHCPFCGRNLNEKE